VGHKGIRNSRIWNKLGSIRVSGIAAAGIAGLGCVAPAAGFAALVSAVLPGSRSTELGNTATAFATVINTGPGTATGCTISPVTPVSADFLYQTTEPATNALTGSPDTPVDIAEGAAQTFVFAFTPTAPFAPTDVELSFDCTNTSPAASTSGLNTLLLSASSTPVPDIIALATGTGTLDMPASAGGAGAFAVATVNVGSTGTITASADTGSAALPVTISVCETNPSTGVCINPTVPAGTATTTIAANETPTFAFFATATGPIAPDPANNRAFVWFTDGGGIVRGSTSTALTSDVPAQLAECLIDDSGWDDINEVPLVPKSFAQYQAAVAACLTPTGRAFTAVDVAGKTFNEPGAIETLTFNANGTGLATDPIEGDIPFTWTIDGFGYLVLSGTIGNVSVRETWALIGVDGNNYSVKFYYEDSTFSDMNREVGADGEIYAGIENGQ